MSFANVSAYLPWLARQQPEALAVAVARPRGGYDQLSARQLDARSDRAAHALVAAGLRRGSRTVLMVNPSLEFFALTFAMLKIGAIPVMVDPGMGVQNLGTCLREADPVAFVGIAKAHVARLLFGWAIESVEVVVSVGSRLAWGGKRLEALMADAPPTPYPPIDPDPEETAAILFTSGSTGVPKGVVTPHRVFTTQVRLLREVFGIEPGERDLSTFPLFALFGPALGMASIVPDMDASKPAAADPAKLVQALRDFDCTNMFASPAIIDKLGRYCSAQAIDLRSLRRAISAGAPASIPALERLQPHLAEGVEILTPYGATEALPVSSIGSRTILRDTRAQTELGAGVCVGRPVPGIEVAIIPIDDDAISTWDPSRRLGVGEIGEIVVRGPVVTPAYFRRAESTRLAKIQDNGATWHRMGDLGHLDSEGRLWMCGRKGHRVETANGRLFTVPCESIFNQHPAVRRSALVGVRRGTAALPIVCIELESGVHIARTTLESELRKLALAYPHTRTIETFLVHPGFPVDVRHNSKIFREQLAIWAEARHPAPQ